MRIIDNTGTDRNSNGSISKPRIKGIIDIKGDTIYLDWVVPSSLYLHVIYDGIAYVGCEEVLREHVFFDNGIGFYRFKREATPQDIAIASKKLGIQQYPYTISREYEAVSHLDLFAKSAYLKDSRFKDSLGDKLKYTFGIEFETSMGVIPEEECFANGLIPLRDGSITGNEYSTIVLGGSTGLGLVKQVTESLKKYTMFNRNCALHIHMGGFPTNRKALFILYQLVYHLERRNYDNLVPRDSFSTAKYKNSGKEYCKKLPENNSFESIFKYFTTMNYLGSFVQPHPADPQRDRKWQIAGRYYGMNLINMFCYKGPKTIEFRFLRPSFNYRKIRLWIAIFNAILEYALMLYKGPLGKKDDIDIYEQLYQEGAPSVSSIIGTVYSGELKEDLLREIKLQSLITDAQHKNYDFFGECTAIENYFFD